MTKKILILGVALIMCLGIFTACSNGEQVEFTVGSALGRVSENAIAKVITSFEETSNSDITTAIVLDGKYDSDFFVNSSLVIVAFQTKTGGAQIDEIKLTKQGSRLTVDIQGGNGLISMVDQVVVVLEVMKDSISGANTVKFTTNLNKI